MKEKGLIFFFLLLLIIICYPVYKTKTTKPVSDMILEKESFPQSLSNFPYQKFYPDLYVNVPALLHTTLKKKTAYLTFDDGPSENTEKILEVLNKYQIKATFFVIADLISIEQEELIRSMAEDGHIIGIHTYSHNLKQIYSSVDAYLEDFNKAYLKLYDITGEKPYLFRFPGGSVNTYNRTICHSLIEEMERRGFTYYDWNVSAEDSVGTPSKYSILKNIKTNIEKQVEPVILMHDSSINNLTAKLLPQIIEELLDKGYTFDTVNNRIPYQFAASRK